MNAEMITNNPFLIISLCLTFGMIGLLLLFVFMPRVEEINRLRRIIDEQHARIDQLSKDSTAAEIAHQKKLDSMKGEYIADIGELTSELAASNGRAAQNASRAEQIARAKDRKRGAA